MESFLIGIVPRPVAAGGPIAPPPASSWLLATGAWADAGRWRDDQNWKDS